MVCHMIFIIIYICLHIWLHVKNSYFQSNHKRILNYEIKEWRRICACFFGVSISIAFLIYDSKESADFEMVMHSLAKQIWKLNTNSVTYSHCFHCALKKIKSTKLYSGRLTDCLGICHISSTVKCVLHNARYTLFFRAQNKFHIIHSILS